MPITGTNTNMGTWMSYYAFANTNRPFFCINFFFSQENKYLEIVLAMVEVTTVFLWSMTKLLTGNDAGVGAGTGVGGSVPCCILPGCSL